MCAPPNKLVPPPKTWYHDLLSTHFVPSLHQPQHSRCYLLQFVGEVTGSGSSSDLLKFIRLVHSRAPIEIEASLVKTHAPSLTTTYILVILNKTRMQRLEGWIKPRPVELLHPLCTPCPRGQLVALGFPSIRCCHDKTQGADTTDCL